ncbi:MAG: hypothetical protein NTX50_16450, partial [Candidatus Sumerlaeota bacterium]|nr:hypothetical protein [Candidatus Sumerlaeota bacterium]
PDPDDAGVKTWLPDLAQLCRNAGCASFRYIMPDAKTGDIDKRLRAGEKLEELLAAAVPWIPPLSDKPQVNLADGRLADATRESWNIIATNNRPFRLFIFQDTPSRLQFGEQGRPALTDLNVQRLRHELAAQIAFYTGGATDRPTDPSKELAENMLAAPVIPLPVLERLVEAPVFDADGRLIATPGYDSQSRILYAPASGFIVPAISLEPSRDDRLRAWKMIRDDLLGDFPFIAECERTHAVALLLLPFVRDMIPGATPLHLIEKPCPGTGASLLVEAIARITAGGPVGAMAEGESEDEWRKRITATLLRSPALILIDNLRRALDSTAVSIALTAQRWEDRFLGASRNINVPIRAAWCATGNNPALSSEISRRTIRIRLDARMDRPWLREPSVFRHPDFTDWIKQNRAALVASCLTIIQAWIAEGKPMGERTLGMYEAWARVMGGILGASGFTGFLDNLSAFYDASDTEGEAQRAFIYAWLDRFGHEPKTSGELFPLGAESGLNLGTGTDRAQQTRFGMMLGRLRDRAFTLDYNGGRRMVTIQKLGIKHSAATWKLSEKGNLGEPGEPFP